MLIIVPVIRNQTDTETVVSPSLLVPAAAQRAYQIYAGNTVVAQVRPGIGAAVLLCQHGAAITCLGIPLVGSCHHSLSARRLPCTGSVINPPGRLNPISPVPFTV